MTRVKICGLMSERDIDLAVQAGADALGFVVEYPIPVPWNLARERVAELVASAPPFVSTTAVVGGTPEAILAIAEAVRPNFLQLHGDETLEEIGQICSTLRPTGTKVLKALRIDVDSGEAMFSLKDPLEAAAALARTSISGLVVDSKTASRPAGTGVPLNWEVAAKIAASLHLPLILAGGLNPENVAQSITQVRPYAVDVISGVERETGVKDERLARDFVRAAKGARAGAD
jgi:phosphoribosylanthranilate isomerase